MTSAKFSRDLQRIQMALAELQSAYGSRVGEQAMRRVMRGERRWSDICVICGEIATDWDAPLMASLPNAVWARKAAGESSRDMFPGNVLGELAAHVPGEPLSARCRTLLSEAEDGWRSPEFEVCMYWVPISQMFGADEGASLRDRCWERVEHGWRPSRAVVQAVHDHGSNFDRMHLANLFDPWQDAKGEVYEFTAVMPGARFVYSLQNEVKTGH